MNLGSQQKWFHNFWTSTLVAKIPQSLLQKLNYKVFLKSLKQENRFPSVAQLCGPRAQHAPTHAAHAARPTVGGARALANKQKPPRTPPKITRAQRYCFSSQRFCTKTHGLTRLHQDGSLACPAHTGVPEAALSGYADPRRASTAQLRGDTHLGTDAGLGAEAHSRGRGQRTPPRRRTTARDDDAVPVNCGPGKRNKKDYEHE
jgi:hypothetical protein